MNSRLAPLLLCAAAVIYACGPRPQHSPRASSAAKASPTVRKHKPTMALLPTLDVKVGRSVDFAFNVTNDSDKKVEIAFPSGQTHDIVVVDPTGREVWRWSSDRMFTQAMQNKLVAGFDTVSFTERWNPEDQHGRFTAIARLTSANHPLEQRTEFELP